MVHLDVKPSNVIMGAPARLIDLSVARSAEAAATLRHPIGTDAYMAPEQCDPPGSGTPGFASDVFGLGATLFEAIAGRTPYDDGRPDAADAADRFPQLVDLPDALPDRVPADVAAVVDACLAPTPPSGRCRTRSPRPWSRPSPGPLAAGWPASGSADRAPTRHSQ